MRASDIEIGQWFKTAINPEPLKRITFDFDCEIEVLGEHVYAANEKNVVRSVHPDSAVEKTDAPVNTEFQFGKIQGRIVTTSRELRIHLDGYGVHGFVDGAPVTIEDRDGVAHLFVWTEKDTKGYTHNLTLAGART